MSVPTSTASPTETTANRLCVMIRILPLVEPVGEDPAERPDHRASVRTASAAFDAERRAAARELPHEPAGRGERHPRADGRHELPHQEQPEVAVRPAPS